MRYDADRAAAFYDEYGEREWRRFEDGRTSPISLEVHTHYLRRFVRAGDRVLDVGAGPGRFTIELARLGASVVVADLSPVQLELNADKVREAGCEDAVVERVLADVTDLSRFGDASFDAVVCYGGPLSYVLERADDALEELLRVTRPGGHVLLSVMSLVGSFAGALPIVVGLDEAANERVLATGYLPSELSAGHLEMRMYRWRELQHLLARQPCQVVAASASNLNGTAEHEVWPTLAAETRRALVRWEIELASEPGAIECGAHILVVARKSE